MQRPSVRSDSGQSNQNILCKELLHASCAWVQLNSDTAVYEHWEQILDVKRLRVLCEHV